MMSYHDKGLKSTKKITLLSILAASAIVINYFESMLPNLAPGVKLGLSNGIIVVTLSLFGSWEALLITLIRSVTAPLLSGNPMGIAFSLPAGICSTLIMAILFKCDNKHFSTPGISAAGAITHNLVQLSMASIIYGTFGLFTTYLPIMMISGLLTGIFIGIISFILVNRIKKLFV